MQVVFQNGDSCGISKWQVTFQIACTPGSTATTYQLSTSMQNACLYTVWMQNQIGCPGGGGGGGGGGDGGSSGLSGGSIFLIALVVALPLYVAVGCLYKRQRMGASGMESCPNIDFWRDLPGLVGDGFKFTWSKLRRLCGKNDGSAGPPLCFYYCLSYFALALCCRLVRNCQISARLSHFIARTHCPSKSYLLRFFIVCRMPYDPPSPFDISFFV